MGSLRTNDRQMSRTLVRQHSADNLPDTDELKINDNFFTDEYQGVGSNKSGTERDGGETSDETLSISPTGTEGRRSNNDGWRKVDSFRSSFGSVVYGAASWSDTPGTTGSSSPRMLSFDRSQTRSGDMGSERTSSEVQQRTGRLEYLESELIQSSGFEGFERHKGAIGGHAPSGGSGPHRTKAVIQMEMVDAASIDLSPAAKEIRTFRTLKQAGASFDSNHSGKSSNGMPTIYSGHNTPVTALASDTKTYGHDPDLFAPAFRVKHMRIHTEKKYSMSTPRIAIGSCERAQHAAERPPDMTSDGWPSSPPWVKSR